MKLLLRTGVNTRSCVQFAVVLSRESRRRSSVESSYWFRYKH